MSIQSVATIIVLRKMFADDGWLSICTLEEMWKMHNIQPDENDRMALHLLHCTHWKDVPVEVRSIVMITVLKSFGMNELVLNASPLRWI